MDQAPTHGEEYQTYFICNGEHYKKPSKNTQNWLANMIMTLQYSCLKYSCDFKSKPPLNPKHYPKPYPTQGAS